MTTKIEELTEKVRLADKAVTRANAAANRSQRRLYDVVKKYEEACRELRAEREKISNA